MLIFCPLIHPFHVGHFFLTYSCHSISHAPPPTLSAPHLRHALTSVYNSFLLHSAHLKFTSVYVEFVFPSFPFSCNALIFTSLTLQRRSPHSPLLPVQTTADIHFPVLSCGFPFPSPRGLRGVTSRRGMGKRRDSGKGERARQGSNSRRRRRRTRDAER